MHRTGLICWIVVIRGDVAAQCLARDALELVTVADLADSAPPGLCALGSSAVRHGYRLTILGANRSAYHDLLESKPRLLLSFLRRDASLNNVVAFVDGFDVLAQRGPGATLAGWAHVGSPDILFGSESYCFRSVGGEHRQYTAAAPSRPSASATSSSALERPAASTPS